jgi:hypothetical protein
MQCEYCGGSINSKPKVLEFANFQRFFCCIGCKNNYREKHAGRIQSIVEQYKEMQKEAKKNNLICLVETNFTSRLSNHWINKYILVRTLYYL